MVLVLILANAAVNGAGVEMVSLIVDTKTTKMTPTMTTTTVQNSVAMVTKAKAFVSTPYYAAVNGAGVELVSNIVVQNSVAVVTANLAFVSTPNYAAVNSAGVELVTHIVEQQRQR